MPNKRPVSNNYSWRNWRLEVTKGNVERLEQAFDSLDLKAKGERCARMKGIVTDNSEAIQDQKSDSEGVLDVAITGGA